MRVQQGTALVGRAGSTMDAIVPAIKRVTDIVGEISAASADQATQQNAALVEQSAAASAGLRQQADELVRAVTVFRTA